LYDFVLLRAIPFNIHTPLFTRFSEGGMPRGCQVEISEGGCKRKISEGVKIFCNFPRGENFFFKFPRGGEEGILLTKISECVVNKFPKISEWIYCNRPTSASISKGLEKNCKFPRGSTKNSKFPRGSSGKTVSEGVKNQWPFTDLLHEEGGPAVTLVIEPHFHVCIIS
jgi:hypothetical protein